MNNKFSENLLLTNETGHYLYETYAKNMPIIDYHCHLLPQEIYENKQFEDLGEMWLAHDHYKWRAMRTFGIAEKYITGDASSYEKYAAFAKIVPQLIGNPIYIWCALELKRYFDIDEPLCEANAEEIYDKTKRLIVEQNMTPRWCMEKSNVEFVSTTEDPVDTLEYHKKMIAEGGGGIKVVSAFRPDKAMFCERDSFAEYVKELATAASTTVESFEELLKALELRLQYFKSIRTTVSDNGIPDFKWEDSTPEEIAKIFAKAQKSETLTQLEIDRYRTAFLYEMARIYNRNGFVMQLHIGTYLDANIKQVKALGQSTGYDCIDDGTNVKSVGILLDHLMQIGELPKTILYPLNSTQIESFAVLAAAFCEGPTKAKVQLGAPWWFNDQAYGIHRQFEAVANLYPVSLSVGMLTDSRSFLSYPRHELYRRILCNYFGTLIERGEYFSKEEDLGRIIQNICYYNAKNFFNISI